jgi:hypothetical protein
MTSLVIAELDNATVKCTALNTVAAASQMRYVQILIAGPELFVPAPELVKAL